MPATFNMLFTNMNGVAIFFKNAIREPILEIQVTLNVVQKISVSTQQTSGIALQWWTVVW